MNSHSAAPHKPTKLSTAGGSTLVYADASKKPVEVHWLDLSDAQPKPAAGKRVIQTEIDYIADMCFIHEGNKHLLIVAEPDEGIFAYNTETDRLEWKVGAKALGMENSMGVCGVTTDGRGHLFVADYMSENKCIQIFSVSDGKYLGRLMKGVETIGNSGKVHWNAETSSLLAACYFQNKWHLQWINIQY